MNQLINLRPEHKHTVSKQLPSINSEQSIKGSDSCHKRTLTREKHTVGTLSPYLVQIERRKKVKSVVRNKTPREKSIKDTSRQLSSKKFRIQECNYSFNHRNESSLRRRRNDDSHNTTTNSRNHNTIQVSEKYAAQRKRGFSRKRVLDDLTIQQPMDILLGKDNDLRELYSKLKTKCTEKRDPKSNFRRGKFEDNDHQPTANVNLRKIAYTVNNMQKPKDSSIEDIKGCNRTVVSNNTNDRRNFRRNKYQVQSQIITNDERKQQTKYNSVDIQKKQSNTSLIRELEAQTQKQVQQQDKVINQNIKKILDKSIEKSTEEYFKQHSQNRKIKSRNQIEMYVSTVKNPSINRCSQASTLNISDKKDEVFVSQVKDNSRELMNYDFYLEPDVSKAKRDRYKSPDIQLPEESEEEGNSSEAVFNQLTQFYKERKEAERKHINNNLMKMSWSEDERCIVNAQEADL